MRESVHVTDEEVKDEHVRPSDHGDPAGVPALAGLAAVAVVVFVVVVVVGAACNVRKGWVSVFFPDFLQCLMSVN